jgi:hypothetical protein
MKRRLEMFDVFKYLSDLTARAHMLEGSINPKTHKLYTKEEIGIVLGLIDDPNKKTVNEEDIEADDANYISDSVDDENKEDQ